MNEQVMKLQKVKKSCRIAKKITRILSIFLIAVMVFCIIGAVICLIFRGRLNPEMAKLAEHITYSDVNIRGVLSFSVNTSGMIEAGKYAEVGGIYCIVCAIILAVSVVVFGTLCNVFSILEISETPFSQMVLKKMKTTFILLVVVLALLTGLGLAVMVGLCLWCIYCILDYGIALQTEIDETI